MSTQTDVKTETASGYSAEVEKLLADSTVAPNTGVIKLVTAIDNIETKMGGKWYDLIVFCKENHLTIGTDDEVKEGKRVLLKTLIAGCGKTQSSAYSIRTQIIKMSQPEFAEALEKMRIGEMTVREARAFGRKPQANPNKSTAQKYREALNNAIRYAIAAQVNPDKFGDDAQTFFNEYLIEQGEAKLSGAAKEYFVKFLKSDEAKA
jgi:hypothetical protein